MPSSPFSHNFSDAFLVALGSANAVGLIPAILGGGIAAGQGAMGLICDNLISARIVTKRGELVTASESENEDLFWGLRGGGQKFGIVTQVTLRIYPSVTFGGREDGLVWSGFFAFSRDKLRSVIEHWNQHGRDDCSLSILFAALPPTFEVRHGMHDACEKVFILSRLGANTALVYSLQQM